MWNRKILLLVFSAGVVQPRPRALPEELHSPQNSPIPVPFNFGYEVSSVDTGDTKSHQETLEDGILRGSYTVVQPDGFRRVVNYVSDAENGFRADVTFEKGYENIIPSIITQQSSVLSAESTGSTSLSQSSSSSSDSLSAKTDSSSSVNLEISDSSLSAGNSASTQGVVSTGFTNTSPLVQVSDINNYGNAQYETSVLHSTSGETTSSHSTSGESSIQDVALTNNEAETSLDTGLSLDTTSITSTNEVITNNFDSTQHLSLDHYNNQQIFCASCNTGSFGSVISENKNVVDTFNGNSNVISETKNTVDTFNGNSNVISETKNTVDTFNGNSQNAEVGLVGDIAPGGVTNIGDIFSRSFLVTSDNLDNIDTVELANAGFDTDNLYAYKLVPVRIVQERTIG